MVRPWYYLLLVCLGGSLMACRAATPPAALHPPVTAAPITPDAALYGAAEAALPLLLFSERNAAQQRDLAQLALLWSPDARIIDGRNSDAPEDDYVWRGREAILDRYELAVFPNPPKAFEEMPTLEIESVADEATARFGIDHWRAVRRDGRWWLAELRYQVPE